MIIKLGLDKLENAMSTITSVVNDKMLQEDLKNLIIWVKEGKVRFVGTNLTIVSAIDVDAEISDVEGDEAFVQLRAKDINDVIASFRGLKKTKVDSVELHIKENEAILLVKEVALADEEADLFNQESKFRIAKTPIKEVIKNQVKNVKLDAQGEDIPAVDMLLYINALYPTVAKETRESTSGVMFGEGHIYTTLASYVAIMENRLPKCISNFRVSNTILNFVKNFITGVDTFNFSKTENGNGAVILTIKIPNAIAQINCADMSRAFEISKFLIIPETGIVVDKMYLIDVLKRLSLSSESIFAEVKIENGVGEMKVASKNMTQNIPVKKAKGEGTFNFSIRPDLLSSVVFSHATQFDENVFLYFATDDSNKLSMACTDSIGLWHTKMNGMTIAKGNFAWN